MRKLLPVVLLAILFVAPANRAEWIWSGIQFSWISIIPTEIDLNEDGIADLILSHEMWGSADIPQSWLSGIFEVDTQGNHIWIVQDYDSPAGPGDFALPVEVPWLTPNEESSVGIWKKGSFSVGFYDVDLINQTWTGWSGPWGDRDLGYLQMFFRDSSDRLHLGWIQLLLPDDSLTPLPAVVSWYHESEPLPEPYGRLITLLPAQDAVLLTFTNVHKGLRYTLEQTTNLVDGAWVAESPFIASTNSVSVTNSMVHQTGYWRLQRVP